MQIKSDLGETQKKKYKWKENMELYTYEIKLEMLLHVK